VVLLALAYYLRAVLNPLLVALGIAYALNPLVVSLSQKRLGRRPLGRTGATVCIFVAFLACFVGALAVAIPVVGGEITHFARQLGGEPVWSAAELAAAREARAVAPDGQTWQGQPVVSKPEPFEDRDGNGRFDEGEAFTDADGDGRWSAAVHFVDFDGNGRPTRGWLRDLGTSLDGWLATLRASLDREPGGRASDLTASASEFAQARAGELASTGFSALGWVAAATLGGGMALFNVLQWLVLVPFYCFFFMRGLDQVAVRGMVYIPASARPRAVAILTRIHCIMSAFIRGRAFIALVVSGMAFGGFALCGVPYALVLGLVTGITILIPFLPIVMAVIPAELLLMAEGAGVGPMAGVIVVYTIIQVVEGFYLTPRVLGHEADMHPVTAFVSVIIGANLLGLLGAILAIPLAATVKILFTELLAPELRDVAGMGPGTETGQTQRIARAVRGELIGGGLVPTELDRDDGA